MASQLRVKTKVEESYAETDTIEDLVPVSPTSEYFSSEFLSVSILAIFESEIPIDVREAHPFLKDVIVPVCPHFDSIMIEDKKGKRMWKKVEVNVQDHIKIPTFPEGLSKEDYTQHFDEYISNLTKEQVPQDKPLWEIHIFTYPTTHAPGIFIFKIHHSIGDGVSLMGAVFSCFQRVDDPSIPLTFPSAKRSRDRARSGNVFIRSVCLVPKLILSGFVNLYDIERAFRWAFTQDDRSPIKSGNTDQLHRFKLPTVTFSLNDVKRIKTALGVVIKSSINVNLNFFLNEHGHNS